MSEAVLLRDATVQEIQEEDWAGEVYVYENQQEIDIALATGRDEYGLMTDWSD